MNKSLYDVCIVGGLAHVGLPLGILLADAGKKVLSGVRELQVGRDSAYGSG